LRSVLIALFVTAILAHGQEPKQMAITFDDLPFSYGRNLTIAAQREAVTRALQGAGHLDAIRPTSR
jgi:hypothetical protein